MNAIFTKYYDFFKSKLKGTEYLDFWDKDNYIREDTKNSVYGALSIEIVSGNVCQLKCKHCYLGDLGGSRKRIIMDTAIIKNIIDQAAKEKNGKRFFSQIAFLGGEPTLHPNILELITYVESRGLTPILVTNGLKFIDIEFTKKLLKTTSSIVMHLPFFPISKESISAQNAIGSSPIYATQLIQSRKNILSLRKEENHIFGNFVISKLSLPYAYDTYVYCRKNRIEPFFEKMRLANDKTYNKKYILNKQDIIQITKKIFQFDYENNYIEASFPKHLNLLSYFTTPIIGKKCSVFKTGLHIKFENDIFGNCFSCCGQTLNHGNILIQSLEKIMNQKSKIKVFQSPEKYLKFPCSTCFILKIGLCNGGCRGDANVCYGSPDAPSPQCIFLKKHP